MAAAVEIISAVLGFALLALAFMLSSWAGRNHLSGWWIGSYSALFGAFALLALNVAGTGGF